MSTAAYLRGQFALYLYYLLVAWVLKNISPPLAQMASQEAALTGAFRSAHQVRPLRW